MNSRERVMRAWKLKEGMPDRIPIQFDLCRSLQDHFAQELEVESRYTDNIFEDVTIGSAAMKCGWPWEATW